MRYEGDPSVETAAGTREKSAAYIQYRTPITAPIYSSRATSARRRLYVRFRRGGQVRLHHARRSPVRHVEPQHRGRPQLAERRLGVHNRTRALLASVDMALAH